MPVKKPEAHPWKWAIFWGAVLGIVFFGTYNNVNQYTATLEPVDSFFFAWETRIPFWPWTIVPYWSIDLFYGLALFLATTKAILFRLVKRLLLAQVLCISGFLLFPLKFAFVRPPVEGIFGNMFAALAQFDLPYNQAPSLHIVLLLVLWRQYRLYTAGSSLRFLVDGWSLLIALSVITTWQHHVIDLITGLWVGSFCLIAIPESDDRDHRWTLKPEPVLERRRLANRYAAGALLLALLAWLLWPGICSALIWWMTAATFYVAMVYRFGSAAHFGKLANGRIPSSHYLFLGPYYVGARISALYFMRTRPSYSEILPGVYLGAMNAQPALVAHLAKTNKKLAGVVDLTAEMPGKNSCTEYHALPTLDLLPIPAEKLAEAAGIVEHALTHCTVLVACALGISRSSSVVAAWLVIYRGYSVNDAIALINQQRPCVILHSNQITELLRIETMMRKQ